MNLIPSAVTARAGLTLLRAQKHSPSVMFGVGVAGVVASAIFASRATLQAAPIIAEHKQFLADIEEIPSYNASYTPKQMSRDKALLLFQTGKKVFKLYAPSIAITALSIGLLTGSHIVLNRRNAAGSAAYAALDKAYRSYRDRVKEQVGDERERELYRGVETEKVVEVDENGKKKQVTKKVLKDDKSAFKVFYSDTNHNGERNPNWSERPEINALFLQASQSQFNNQLQSKGFIFLNEVLDHLGMARTKEGQKLGWFKDSKVGDGFIDFGIFQDEDTPRLYSFCTGNVDGIWLNFNVDGDILDQI